METEYAKKFLSGTTPTVADWEAHLQVAHSQDPSMTSNAYGRAKSADGFTSYQFLAKSLECIAEPRPVVLDLACGDGFLIRSLATASRIIGVDMSKGELNVARRNFPSIEFIQARAQDLPLPSQSVDAVLCHMAFMLMLPVESVIQEIFRVLKPGGIFGFVVNPEGVDSEFEAKMYQVIGQFRAKRFPNVAPNPPFGDPRTVSSTGVKELFQSTVSRNVQIDDFAIRLESSKEEFWDDHRTLYFTSIFPPEAQLDLRDELFSHFPEWADRDGKLRYDFALRRVIVRK